MQPYIDIRAICPQDTLLSIRSKHYEQVRLLKHFAERFLHNLENEKKMRILCSHKYSLEE